MDKSVSLVLGSGGARGYAHIGVIDALEERGYEIASISGCSMGALVGGLYAAGKLEAYREWVLSFDLLDVLKLVDFSFVGSGVIRGDKVFDTIGEMIGDQRIEDLPVKFTAVATDIGNKKEVWFQKGSLLDAIRASIAIPSIFTPKEIGGRMFVDGGVLNPLPTVPVLSDSSDLTIAVNLNGEDREEKALPKVAKMDSIKEKALAFIQENFFSKKEEGMDAMKILHLSLEAMQNLITRYELAAHKPDLIIDIPGNACEVYDFHRAKEMIAYGKRLANTALDRHEAQRGEG